MNHILITQQFIVVQIIIVIIVEAVFTSLGRQRVNSFHLERLPLQSRGFTLALCKESAIYKIGRLFPSFFFFFFFLSYYPHLIITSIQLQQAEIGLKYITYPV